MRSVGERLAAAASDAVWEGSSSLTLVTHGVTHGPLLRNRPLLRTRGGLRSFKVMRQRVGLNDMVTDLDIADGCKCSNYIFHENIFHTDYIQTCQR